MNRSFPSPALFPAPSGNLRSGTVPAGAIRTDIPPPGTAPAGTASTGTDQTAPTLPSLAGTALEAELGPHFGRFISYARSFDSGDPSDDRYLRLKEEHCFNVLRIAERIAGTEAAFAAPAMRRALLLAALYHDLARFPQYRQFRTFSDPRSFNHGHRASREIRGLDLLRDETPAVARAVRAAVAVHNRFSLPEGLPAGIRAVAEALRDADKLDILRIMHEALRPGVAVDPVILLHVEDSPRISPRILEALAARRTASYSDLATNTDFRLLLCCWFYDLRYAASRHLAATSGIYRELAALLPDAPELTDFLTRFRDDLARAARADKGV